MWIDLQLDIALEMAQSGWDYEPGYRVFRSRADYDRTPTALASAIAAFVSDRRLVRAGEVARAVGLPMTRSGQTSIGIVLYGLGWRQTRPTDSNGRRVRIYVR